MTKSTGVPRPSLLVMERTGLLRVLYLEHYDRDEEFRDLLEVIATHPPGLEMAPLRVLAAQSGLDRLRAQDGNPSGPDLLRKWVRARRRSSGSFPLWQPGWGGPVPDIDTRVDIVLAGEWRLSERSRGDARKDLLRLAGAAIDEQLARIERDAKAGGYVPIGRATERDKHIHWLFLRVRHRLTYAEISERVSDETSDALNIHTIRRAVDDIAALVGIDLPGR